MSVVSGLEQVGEWKGSDPKNPELLDILEKAKAEGESFGAILNVKASGVPAGLGEPIFKKLKAELAHATLERELGLLPLSSVSRRLLEIEKELGQKLADAAALFKNDFGRDNPDMAASIEHAILENAGLISDALEDTPEPDAEGSEADLTA